MDSFDFSGTYMTSWLQPDGVTLVPGPVVVDVSTQSVTFNGVAIKSPWFEDGTTMLSWSTNWGNATSADLTFYQINGVNGFVAIFAEGANPLPNTNNLFGLAATAAQGLSTWNGVYNVFADTGDAPIGQLVIDGAAVTYLGESIAAYDYTGQTPPGQSEIDQLAWFTTAGAQQNMILQFAKDSAGGLSFYGVTWTDGAQPPQINVSGATKPSSTPPTITVALIMQLNTATTIALNEVTVVEEVAMDEQGELKAAIGARIEADPSGDAKAAGDLADKAKLLGRV